MSALTLTHRQLWERLQISRSLFYRMKAAGAFDKLESPIPERYSLEKVENWLAGRSIHSRVTAAWRSNVSA